MRIDLRRLRLLIALIFGLGFSILAVFSLHEKMFFTSIFTLILVFFALLVDCEREFHVIPMIFILAAIAEFFIYTNYLLFLGFFIISCFAFLYPKMIEFEVTEGY